jgi:hypothetical protein
MRILRAPQRYRPAAAAAASSRQQQRQPAAAHRVVVVGAQRGQQLGAQQEAQQPLLHRADAVHGLELALLRGEAARGEGGPAATTVTEWFS